MTKAQARDTYANLVGEIRAVWNSTALLMWHKNNWCRVDAMPVSWHRGMNEEFDISLKALLESENGAAVEINTKCFPQTATEKEPNMELNQIFAASDTLAAEDLQGSDVVLTIKSVEIVEYEDDGYKKKKPVLHFTETEKKLISNKTNSMVIGEHHGNDTDEWVGHKITLYPTHTSFNSKTVPCIRVRPPVTGKTVSQGLPGSEASLGHVNQDVPDGDIQF